MRIVLVYLHSKSIPVQICDSLEEAERLKSKETNLFFSHYEDYWLVPKKYSDIMTKCGHERV